MEGQVLFGQWVAHAVLLNGDILVMGQCQDEFLHCVDPSLDSTRLNSTSCPFL